MSVQSLSTVADAKITPASASFKAAAVATQGDAQHTSLLGLIFSFPTITKTGGNHGRKIQLLGMDTTLPQAQDDKLDKDVEAVVEDTKVKKQKPQRNSESTEPSKATANEAEHARTNWLELRERVENVGPRVFAYHDDPKYVQQCEDAKQRRALAAAMCISPSWH